jgi:purine-binding chemotaxis protein CheW
MSNSVDVCSLQQGSLQLASFWLGDMLLGIDIQQVQEINRNLQLTRVPHAAPAVRGVINLRGEVVTVIDLRTVLKLPQVPVSRESRNVIVTSGNDQIGLLVDRVADVITASHEEVGPRPGNLDRVDASFFSGVLTLDSGLLVILDIEETLAAVASDRVAQL